MKYDDIQANPEIPKKLLIMAHIKDLPGKKYGKTID